MVTLPPIFPSFRVIYLSGSLLLVAMTGPTASLKAASPGATGADSRCATVESKDWEELSRAWRGRELVAFASWCSSCKHKILAAKASPANYVFLSVFEDPQQSADAMRRLELTSPCIHNNDLATKLGVKSLPWSKKI